MEASIRHQELHKCFDWLEWAHINRLEVKVEANEISVVDVYGTHKSIPSIELNAFRSYISTHKRTISEVLNRGW